MLIQHSKGLHKTLVLLIAHATWARTSEIDADVDAAEHQAMAQQLQN